MDADQQQHFAERVAEEVTRKLRAEVLTGPVGQPPPPPATTDPLLAQRLDRIEALLGLEPLTAKEN